MSSAKIGGVEHLRIAAILSSAIAVFVLLVDLVVSISLSAETSVISRYGYGHVPAADLSIYVRIGKVVPSVITTCGVLQIGVFSWFLHGSAKALDRLGIEHRFSRLFTALSMIIPLCGLYVPWAALGEARGTFARMVKNQCRSAKSIRAFDLPSFLLGCIWLGDAFVNRLLSTGAGTYTAATWHATMSASLFRVIIGAAFDAVFTTTLVIYFYNFLRLHRGALLATTAEIFGGEALPSGASAAVPASS